MTQFDVVIPAHEKDLPILEYCIDAVRKKISGVRRIIVVSKQRYTNKAEWFDESLFPFSFNEVASYVGGSAGWYFQQLLKLYAAFTIPDISENILILDSDTVFFRRVHMLDSQGRALYNISKDTKIERRDFDRRVADHIRKLLPEIAVENLPRKFQTISGISHHMVFNREILRDLFARVEAHDGGGDPFYKIFLKHANHAHSAGEYQLYFNFILVFHPDKMQVRKLFYKNTADFNITKYRFRFKYHYCSFHSYLRGTKGNSLRARVKDFLWGLLSNKK
ncbi:MAG: hypothetical protein FJX34_05020 [Alphaproteobacteria bacterium]|nr:hypothetical protein [Alphaproteobacteria bacterium]